MNPSGVTNAPVGLREALMANPPSPPNVDAPFPAMVVMILLFEHIHGTHRDKDTIKNKAIQCMASLCVYHKHNVALPQQFTQKTDESPVHVKVSPRVCLGFKASLSSPMTLHKSLLLFTNESVCCCFLAPNAND